MIRILKTIGLAAMAAMALGAFASAASAQELGIFTAGTTPEEHANTYLTGEQVGEENYFEVPYGKVTCENSGVSYTGEASGGEMGGTDTELTVTPTYEECVGLGGFETHVDMTGCHYEFLQPESVGEGEYTGNTNLYCPEGKHVDVEVTTFLGNCDFTVLPANNLGDVTYTVEEEEIKDEEEKEVATYDDVTAHANVTGIPWTLDPTSGICNTHDEGGNAVFKSTVTVRGYEDEAHETQGDVWISVEE